jgi:hypothetical protein
MPTRNRNKLESKSDLAEWNGDFSVMYILTSKLTQRDCSMRELLIGSSTGQGRVIQLPKWGSDTVHR